MDGVAVVIDPPVRGPVCACTEAMAPLLATENGTIGTDRRTGAVSIYIRRIDPEGQRPPFVVAAYCPFCGERYEPAAG